MRKRKLTGLLVMAAALSIALMACGKKGETTADAIHADSDPSEEEITVVAEEEESTGTDNRDGYYFTDGSRLSEWESGEATEEDLQNATFRAYFEPYDVGQSDDGTLDISMDVYEVDRYAADVLDSIRLTDTIHLNDQNIQVKSFEKTEDGSYKLNGGMYGDGYTFILNNEGYYTAWKFSVETYSNAGVFTFDCADDLTFYDNRKMEGLSYSGEEAKQALLENEDIFPQSVTWITTTDGLITEVRAEYAE